jgi:hypothetical protein
MTDDLKDALDKLCNSLDEFELTLILLDKYKDLKIVSKKLLYKKVEDGILSNLHNAQIYQLDELRKGSWHFNYYDFNDIKPILDIAYNNAIRREKLKNIERL